MHRYFSGGTQEIEHAFTYKHDKPDVPLHTDDKLCCCFCYFCNVEKSPKPSHLLSLLGSPGA